MTKKLVSLLSCVLILGSSTPSCTSVGKSYFREIAQESERKKCPDKFIQEYLWFKDVTENYSVGLENLSDSLRIKVRERINKTSFLFEKENQVWFRGYMTFELSEKEYFALDTLDWFERGATTIKGEENKNTFVEVKFPLEKFDNLCGEKIGYLCSQTNK